MWEIVIFLISLLIGFVFIWLCHWRLKNKATDISDLYSYKQELHRQDRADNNQNIGITQNHENIE